MATPANASTASSPQSICGSGFGVVSGGVQPVKTSSGRRYGTVYLLYSRRTGENCVVTVKTSFVGTKTPVSATLTIMSRPMKDTKQSPIVRTDSGRYKSYAGPVKYWAKGACVKFWGTIKPLGHDPAVAGGGRNSWGNCG
ncbi:MAG: hypothetical protein HOV96_03115 [Nonomuraea sp.]|nr:hypothetical protein [Nonomuraea sp.]NUP68684.1 hypothetical protein [Nonomuraea sp.]NUP76523.1 hypothetical protein [Nonomuraea sp.]NUS03482.1 hypothetical protein [Nonomuraea sp.]